MKLMVAEEYDYVGDFKDDIAVIYKNEKGTRQRLSPDTPIAVITSLKPI